MIKNASPGKKPIKFDIERRNKRRIILIVVFALLAAFSFMYGIYRPLFQATKQPEIRDFKALSYFPLEKGNSWSYIYENNTSDKQGKSTSQMVMEVKQAYTSPNYYLAIIHGDPVLCDPNADYGYLMGSNKIYYIPKNSLQKFEEAARHKGNLPMDKAAEINSPAFEMPLFNGLRWGSEESLFRKDAAYSWQVTGETYVQLGSKKKSPVIRCYEINQRTDLGQTSLLFSPGLGIVKSSYKSGNDSDSYVVRLSGTKIKDQK